MNAKRQLAEDVEILLENSLLENSYDYYNLVVERYVSPQGAIEGLIDDPEEYKLCHEQSGDLVKLYQQQNLEGQKYINLTMAKAIGKGIVRAQTSVKFFVASGQIGQVIKHITKELDAYSSKSALAAAVALNQHLHYQWHLYGIEEIKAIRKWSSDYLDHKSKLGKEASSWGNLYKEVTQVMRALYWQTNVFLSKDVKKRIGAGHNPEINVDKEVLKVEFAKFGFPSYLSETLDKIDSKFSQAQDAFDFKGCMDLIRSFTESLYRSVLNGYGEKGKKIDEKDSEQVAKFFKDERLVSEHFANMIAQMRHFLSNNASHRLKSREEDARLTKNMVIEMSLYLLRRYENH